jgi:hypothetical protein
MQIFDERTHRFDQLVIIYVKSDIWVQIGQIDEIPTIYKIFYYLHDYYDY